MNGRSSQKIRQMLIKVPEATVFFWITKILTTGMGETTSDFLVSHMNPVIAIALAGIVLIGSLVMQFRARKYIPWIYWFAVIMVSIFGTMAADVMHVGFGIPYIVSTIFFAIVLAVIFAAWYASEKTLSIHSITTGKREVFYWLTILTTFALGTALGDMTATTLHLGYFASGILFAVLIAIPAIAYWKFELNAIAAFWVAYILTRPLGASFADWAGVSHARGGLALGTGLVSLVLFIVILFLITHLSAKYRNNNRALNAY
jgi:uncharacterized membrane-anchored protein